MEHIIARRHQPREGVKTIAITTPTKVEVKKAVRVVAVAYKLVAVAKAAHLRSIDHRAAMVNLVLQNRTPLPVGAVVAQHAPQPRCILEIGA